MLIGLLLNRTLETSESFGIDFILACLYSHFSIYDYLGIGSGNGYWNMLAKKQGWLKQMTWFFGVILCSWENKGVMCQLCELRDEKARKQCYEQPNPVSSTCVPWEVAMINLAMESIKKKKIFCSVEDDGPDLPGYWTEIRTEAGCQQDQTLWLHRRKLGKHKDIFIQMPWLQSLDLEKNKLKNSVIFFPWRCIVQLGKLAGKCIYLLGYLV